MRARRRRDHRLQPLVRLPRKKRYASAARRLNRRRHTWRWKEA